MRVSRSKLWKLAEYEPHSGTSEAGSQWLFHNSSARFKVPICGRRYGKSQMASMDKIDKLFVPKCIWWIVSDTYSTGEEEFIYIEDAMDKICRALGVKVESHAHNLRTGEMYLRMPWGARVEVKSAQHPKALVGKGLGCVTFGEAAKIERYVWEQLISPALSDHKSPADFPTTPEGDNWVKELYDFGQPELGNGEPNPAYVGNGGEWESWNLPAWENPKVYPMGFADNEVRRQMKTPEGTPFFWQEIGARFGAMVGRIYPDFSRERHVKEDLYDFSCPNYEFMDFGFNVMVALDVQLKVCQTCGKLRYHVWREYVGRDKTIGQNLIEMESRLDPDQFKIDGGFGDAADPGSIEVVARTRCQMMAEMDAKDFTRGVGEVQGLINPMDCPDPHFTVSPDCTETIYSLGNYRWPREKVGDEREPRETSTKPKSNIDHIPDALRYGVVHLEVLGAKYHLSDVFVPARAGLSLAGSSIGGRDSGEGTIFSKSRMGEF